MISQCPIKYFLVFFEKIKCYFYSPTIRLGFVYEYEKNNSNTTLLTLSLYSCQYLNRQIPDQDELLQKELKSINWNQVDELPNFTSCDSVADKTQKKQCFLSTSRN